MIINTQYTSDINLAEAIQISLLHQNHDHIHYDEDQMIGLMYIPIEGHPHTIFHPPGKCNQFTFRFNITREQTKYCLSPLTISVQVQFMH